MVLDGSKFKAMKFYEGGFFHIYNQGNNRVIIFPRLANYYYFLWKMRMYLLPFGNLIAYCLMPNHFHWFFLVKRVEMPRKELQQHVLEVEAQRCKEGDITRRFRYRVDRAENELVTLNQSIGILQRTYTRAINKQENRTGSLFRKKCKAKDSWGGDIIELNEAFSPFYDSYTLTCIRYIHQNPVKAGLVGRPEDWPFSSVHFYDANQSFCILEDVFLPAIEEVLQIGAIPLTIG